MLRTPLWPPVTMKCHPVGSFCGAPVRVLDLHELAAGKLAALIVRSTCRDIFDACGILASPGLDRAKLRLALVVYDGVNRKDWRTVSPSDVKSDAKTMQTELIPVLRSDLAPARGEIEQWTSRQVAECRERLSVLFPLVDNERDFLRLLNETGHIAPDLLTDDVVIQTLIRHHPGLKWKALNVRKHRGLPVTDAENEGQ